MLARLNIELILLSAALFCSACTASAPIQLEPVAPEQSLSTTKEPETFVKITWLVPEEPVDAFVLSYGPNLEQMTERIRIPLTELKRETSILQGEVFVYRLESRFPDPELYVSLRSEQHGKLSPFSEPFQVEQRMKK